MDDASDDGNEIAGQAYDVTQRSLLSADISTTAVEDPSKVEVKARSSNILKLLFSPDALRLPRYAILHHH